MASEKKKTAESLNNAEDIIKRFGGIRPMATKMGVPVTTVQGWKKRNVIPGNRREELIAAAQGHDIDLSGIIEEGGANENVTSFDSVVSETSAVETAADTERHEKAVELADKTFEAQKDDRTLRARTGGQEGFFGEIKKSESRAVQKSTLASTILLILVGGFGALLLWPTKQVVVENTQRIETLETKTVDETTLLEKFMPAKLEAKVGELQMRTENIQSKLEEAQNAASVIMNDVVADDAGTVSQRLNALETQVAALGVPSDITSLISKINSLQQTAEGQLQLDGSMSDLQALLMQEGGNVDTALAQAQESKTALGETLEDVPQTDLKAAAMLLGLAQFRSSLHRSEAFEDDLVILQRLVGEDDPELMAAIDRLAPKTKQGALTPAGLSGEFKGLAGDIVVSSLKGEDVTVKEKAMARFNDVMQVQKDGELITGTDTQATVVRAQALLDQGDVSGALAELQVLEGDAATAASPFMEQAEATLMVQQLQEVMTSKVIDKVNLSNLSSGGQAINSNEIVRELKSLTRNITGGGVYRAP